MSIVGGYGAYAMAMSTKPLMPQTPILYALVKEDRERLDRLIAVLARLADAMTPPERPAP